MGQRYTDEHVNIHKRVWKEDAPDAAHQAMREALVICAEQITHECGTEEASYEACAETIRDFLDYELIQACACQPYTPKSTTEDGEPE